MLIYKHVYESCVIYETRRTIKVAQLWSLLCVRLQLSTKFNQRAISLCAFPLLSHPFHLLNILIYSL